MPDLGSVIWGTSLRKTVTSTAAAIAAVAGAIVAVPPAWSALGLPEIASKMFVHEQVDPIKLVQADTTKALYQLQLQGLQGSLYAAERDKQTAPSQTVDERIEQLQRDIASTQAKINAGH